MNHRVTDYALNFDKKELERKVQLQGNFSIKTRVYNKEVRDHE